MDNLITKSVDSEVEKVTEQRFIEPVFYRYKSKYFYFEKVSGLRKIYLEFADGRILDSYALFSRVKRKYKSKVFLEDNKYSLRNDDILFQFVNLALLNITTKNDLMLDSDLCKLNSIYDPQKSIEIQSLDMVLYYLNGKMLGGYWLTLKDDEPFNKLKCPKYKMPRRIIQKLQTDSSCIFEFEHKLLTAIEGAYLKKSETTRDFYGQV